MGASEMPRAHVLIVDDDQRLLHILADVVRAAGMDVDTSTGAAHALERIEAGEYDAIVCDVTMPGMDGLTLLQEIRRLRPGTPTVLVSGHGHHDLALRALRAGAFDLLEKPVEAEVLIASIARAVQVRSLSREVEAQRLRLERHAAILAQAVDSRTRELQEAIRLKDEFLANVSHELRTPLNAVLGWAHMLEQGGLDPATQVKAVSAIARNARAQARLIEDLLDVSRIITGKLRLDVRPVKLGPVMDAALEACLPAAEAKGIRIERRLDTSVEEVPADADRLQQVLWNLVSNAIKFTPEHGSVQVSARRAAAQVEIRVEDTGAGMSPEFLPHAFDRFIQEQDSTTKRRSGLGLGLAIVRHIVELHGGSVAASSDGVGHGSTFTVCLPTRVSWRSLEHVMAQSAAAVNEQPGESSGRLDGTRILLIEDDEDARELLVLMLAQAGAEPLGVGSVAEALAALDRRVPDIVLSDLGLPGEDGFVFLSKLRSRPSERGGTIPVAALTAYATREDARRVLEAGFAAHIAKPAAPRQLTRVLQRLVREARAGSC